MRQEPTSAQLQIRVLVEQLLAENGDNKSAVGKMLGVTDVTVGYWVKGERRPSAEAIDKVIRRLRLRREFLDRKGGHYRDYLQPIPARLAAWLREREDVSEDERRWLAAMPDATPEWAWSAALALYRESSKA